MQFQDDVVGGVTLIRPAIQSPNFVTGSAGWAINQDGSAEFSNVVIRGSSQVGGAILFYDGAPALGNLVISIAQDAGTDSFGNSYPAGIRSISLDPIENDRYIWLDTDGSLNVGDSNADFPGFLVSEAGSVTLLAPNNNVDPGSDPPYITMTSGNSVGTPHAEIVMSSSNTGNVDVVLQGRFTTYNDDVFDTYTPVIANGGTATFTSRTGWYQRIGKMIFVNAEFVVNAAGSGAGLVTVSLPFTPFRTNTRQTMSLHSKGAWTAGMAANGCAVIMDTGAGDVIDQLASSNDNALNRDGVITGANLLAGCRITVEGWYREA